MAQKTPAWYRIESIKIAKALVRRQGFCDWCGAVPALLPGKNGVLKMKPQLHGAHIMPEEYIPTCADTNNILSICAGCHRLKKRAWHKSPLEAAEWFHAKYPGKYEYLKEKAYSTTEINWEETYWELRSRKDALTA